MKHFIFWTAVISLASGIALQLPKVAAILMPGQVPGMLTHLFGCMAIFIAATLIVCSRDLENRAPIVMWEAVLRLAGFGIMAGYGLSGGEWSLIVGGVFDLVIALIYVVYLPSYLDLSPVALLLDRKRSVRSR